MKVIKFRDGSEQFIPEKGDEAYDTAPPEQKRALDEAAKKAPARKDAVKEKK